MVSGCRDTTYPQRCAVEKRRIDQDISLVYKLAIESIFNGTDVLMMVRTAKHLATSVLSEQKNPVAHYTRTDVRKASFAVRVTDPWNRLPEEHKNASSSMIFKRIRKWGKLVPR
jgi:hypothetical protein